jgi:hypothetical protein
MNEDQLFRWLEKTGALKPMCERGHEFESSDLVVALGALGIECLRCHERFNFFIADGAAMWDGIGRNVRMPWLFGAKAMSVTMGIPWCDVNGMFATVQR